VPWYLAGGVSSANCVAAYCPLGAASQAASYINLANPGTYDLTASGSITWATEDGWTGATGAYLATGIVPGRDWCYVARFTDAVDGEDGLLGLYDGAGKRLEIRPKANGDNRLFFDNGGALTLAIGTGITAGCAAINGRDAYKNGAKIGTPMADWGADPVKTVYIATVNGINQFFRGKIQAVAIYNITFSEAQMATLYSGIMLAPNFI